MRTAAIRLLQGTGEMRNFVFTYLLIAGIACGMPVYAADSGTSQEDSRSGTAEEDKGYADVSTDYNEKTRTVTQTYLDQNGISVEVDGYATTEAQYDENGCIIKESYFHSDGTPASRKSGYHTVTAQYADITESVRDMSDSSYEPSYQPVRLEYFDEDDKPVMIHAKDGSEYASVIRSYDPFGNVTYEAKYDTDGDPIINVDGSAGVIMEYADITAAAGRSSEAEENGSGSFGQSGAGTDRSSGGKYGRNDDQGNPHEPVWMPVRTTYVDENQKPVNNEDGWATVVDDYDVYGNATYEAWYDASGRPYTYPEGYSADRKEYADVGNDPDNPLWAAVSTVYLDKGGRPVETEDGYVQIRDDFDTNGNIIREYYLDNSAEPVEREDGYSEVHYEWADVGDGDRSEEDYSPLWRAVKTSYYDGSGNPVTVEDGYSAVSDEYDASGNVIREAYYNVEGSLASPDKLGYAVRLMTYNEDGQVTGESYLDSEGNPTLSAERVAEVKTDYGQEGQIIQVATYGTDGSLTNSKDGYAVAKYEYDADGNLLGVATYGTDGQPHDSGAGYATQKVEHVILNDLLKGNTGQGDIGPAEGSESDSEMDAGTGETDSGVETETESEPDLSGIPETYRIMGEHGAVSADLTRYYNVNGEQTSLNNSYAVYAQYYDKAGKQIGAAYLSAGLELRQVDEHNSISYWINSQGSRTYYDTAGNVLKRESLKKRPEKKDKESQKEEQGKDD